MELLSSGRAQLDPEPAGQPTQPQQTTSTCLFWAEARASCRGMRRSGNHSVPNSVRNVSYLTFLLLVIHDNLNSAARNPRQAESKCFPFRLAALRTTPPLPPKAGEPYHWRKVKTQATEYQTGIPQTQPPSFRQQHPNCHEGHIWHAAVSTPCRVWQFSAKTLKLWSGPSFLRQSRDPFRVLLPPFLSRGFWPCSATGHPSDAAARRQPDRGARGHFSPDPKAVAEVCRSRGTVWQCRIYDGILEVPP